LATSSLKKLNRKTAGVSSARPVKVIQFGEGNFLRAFVDWIFDILNEKTEFNGSIDVIQPIAQGMGSLINEQDGLYHVVLNGIKDGKPSTETRIITSVNRVINPFEELPAYMKAAENPDLRFIVSNTTEAGIAFNPTDNDPGILPESFPGKLTIFLWHRYSHFQGDKGAGLIFLPCELIEKNGDNLKRAILQYADHWHLPGAFGKWISQDNKFCNTLVDRIVPGYPKDTIHQIQAGIGYDDKLVVTAEHFHLWVIEGDEGLRKELPTEKAGLHVKFTSDLTPYRTRKVRILNGAHTAMVPIAYLMGLRRVKESIDHPVIGDFVRKCLYEEIIPTLDLSKEELHQFAHDVIERFQNPFIRHELSSIALNSISKFKVRVLPSLLRYFEIKAALPEKLVLSLAALIQFYKGQWNGEAIPVSDSPEVVTFFKNAWTNPSVFEVATLVLGNKDFWGADLTKVPGLPHAITGYLESFARHQKIL
jgi:tagaturonate reductase